MEQLLIIGLLGMIIFLWIKNQELSKSADAPIKSESQSAKITLKSSLVRPSISELEKNTIQDRATSKTLLHQTQSSQAPSMNTGIAELDGPGMYHRLNRCGPQGHVCYLIHSSIHGAYKVGICKPERLGTRIKAIQRVVADVKVVGTAVFTSYQNAFNAEQGVIGNNRNYRYRGITGEHAGGTEWLSRRPTQRRPAFTSPKHIEEKYAAELESPLPALNIPDNYTIYLVYSKRRNVYKAKWCKSNNLMRKLEKLRSEEPDTKILSRIKIERHEKAREITKKMNTDNDSYSRSGRTDVIHWSVNPSYLNSFKGWDKDGNKIIY